MTSYISSGDQTHQDCPSPWRRRGYFTLTELLIVIAILLVLVSLMNPVLRNMIERTRTFQCSNQLKGLGIAMSTYTGDHEYYTPGSWWENGGGRSGTWSYDDYLGYGGYDGRGSVHIDAFNASYISMWWYLNRGIPLVSADLNHQYRCPTQPLWNFSRLDRVYWERTYGMGYVGSLRSSSIPAPSRTIMLCESKGNDGDRKVGNDMGAGVWSPDWQSSTRVGTYYFPFHQNCWNYLFCDGSMRTLYPLDTMKKGNNMRNPGNMWSVDPTDDE